MWAEKMTFRTVLKMWYRILFSLPWHYHLFHAFLVLNVLYPLYVALDPLWLIVYAVGFHFVFPKQLKQFHGAEHKVFSHTGRKTLDQLDEIARASIVNSGCSTNVITYFFVFFLPALLILPLVWSILAGFAGVLLCSIKHRYVYRIVQPLLRISAFLQKYVTTKEPERLHLETAVRSYQLFVHYRD